MIPSFVLEESHIEGYFDILSLVDRYIKSLCEVYSIPFPRVCKSLPTDVVDYVDKNEIRVKFFTDNVGYHSKKLFAHYLCKLHAVGGMVEIKVINLIADLLRDVI